QLPKPSDLVPKPDIKGGVKAAAAGLANGGGMGAVTSQAKAMVPTPQSITSKLSPSSLMEMIDGTITRTVRKTFTRKVGGAYIALAGGPIAHRGNKVLVELIGGVKVATSAKNSLSQS